MRECHEFCPLDSELLVLAIVGPVMAELLLALLPSSSVRPFLGRSTVALRARVVSVCGPPGACVSSKSAIGFVFGFVQVPEVRILLRDQCCASS